VLFVAVYCGGDLFIGVCVCMCVVHCLVRHAYFIFLVSACESAGSTCVICCVWSLCV
jgi:hypothetical protein